MKKTTVLLLLMTVASAYAQNLKTSIDGSLLNQGAKGINAIKLRNTLHLMTDSIRLKPTKLTLGLGNVDNTSDINKPISSAVQIALNSKADIYSQYSGELGVFVSKKVYGVPAPPDFLPNISWHNIFVNGDDFDLQQSLGINNKLDVSEAATTYAPKNNPVFTGNVSGISKNMVGLGNVDNTSDINKPISSATSIALDTKQDKFNDYNGDYGFLISQKVSPIPNEENPTPTPYQVIDFVDAEDSNLKIKLGLQEKLSGNGFLKLDGENVSYDNSTYAGLTANNVFTGSNTFFTPVFANSTSTSSYSKLTGTWSGTGNIATFSLGYESKFGGNTITRTPLNFDYNGSVGVGIISPTVALDVSGSIKSTSTVSAVTLSSSSTSYFASSSGNVGIGTSSPQKKLVVSNVGVEGFEIDVVGYTGGIRNIAYNRTTSAYIPLRTEASQHEFYIGATERMRIDASGNVGIGGTPTEKLDVTGNIKVSGTSSFTGNISIVGLGTVFNNSASLDLQAGSSATNGLRLGTSSATSVKLYTNGIDRFFINSAGNVGIGDINPSDKLSIRSTVSADVYTRFQGTGSTAGGFQIGLGGINQVALLNRENTDMEFYTNNSLKAIIKANGKVGVGTTIPIRSKLNISDINKTVGSNDYNLYVNTDDAQGSNIGASLGLGGQTGTDNNAFAVISGRKENSTSGDYAGYLQFATPNGSASMTEKMRISSNGNVGIGTTAPNAPLQFSNTILNRKIVLYDALSNDFQFYGFGVNAGALKYSVATTGDAHIFHAGTSSTTSQQLLSINGDQTVTYTPLTTSQINALVKVDGKMAYNGDTDKPVWCNGTVWKYADGSNM